MSLYSINREIYANSERGYINMSSNAMYQKYGFILSNNPKYYIMYIEYGPSFTEIRLNGRPFSQFLKVKVK